MAWLGQPLPDSDQDRQTHAPRCVKDELEEALFDRRRDLFSDLDLVFFDTTSHSFHGAGGETLGRRGKSKGHRPQCRQMVLGLVLDNQGLPVCSEMWPGNTADVTTLVPVAERLQQRFGIRSVCLVADRVSSYTVSPLQEAATATSRRKRIVLRGMNSAQLNPPYFPERASRTTSPLPYRNFGDSVVAGVGVKLRASGYEPVLIRQRSRQIAFRPSGTATRVTPARRSCTTTSRPDRTRRKSETIRW